MRTDEHRAALKEAQNRPGAREKMSAALKEAWDKPGARERQSAAKKKFYEDPEARERQSVAMKEAQNRPGARERQSVAQKEAQNRPGARERQSAALKEAWDKPGAREKMSAALKEAWDKPGARERQSVAMKEAHVGGFCIQNITYDERKKYCELWNPNLWRRIDACQGNRSIISGKTKEDNGGRALSRHHVYWQEKACCVWDEDAQGYFAMIDIGTKSKPEMYKHYINGSPNKFVLLTHEEHGMIRGNKKLGTTKLTWIKTLEDLIETKLDGKCFYTEEEYAELSLGGRFTGEGRKVGHGKLTGEQIAIVKKATGFEPDINFS